MALARHLVMLGPAPCASCGTRGSWLCAGCANAARRAPAGPCPPEIDSIVVPWAYAGGPRSLVLALKLRHMTAAAAPLIQAMVRATRRSGLDADVVTWVPARARDVSGRGFDHAEVLARGVGTGLGLPVAGLLKRRGIQPDQSGLDRRQRQANLKGAFVAPGRVSERTLLVDDLVTTGATATSCAGALKAAGASEVYLLTACRA